MIDVDKLRHKLTHTLDAIDTASCLLFGGPVAPLGTDWADQLSAGLRDDLRGIGLDPGDPDHLHAVLGGTMVLVALWESSGSTFTMRECQALSHLARLLLQMADTARSARPIP